MESNRDPTGSGVPRWAAPWAAGWSGMADQREARSRQHVLPENSQHRIKRIGIAASSVAVLVWCTAIVWLWPVVA